MVTASHSSSSISSKVFTTSPDEENRRTKFQRTESLNISTTFPVFVPGFGKSDSSVFAFTATRNEHSKPPTRRSRNRNGSFQCHVCKRHKVAESGSTTREMWASAKSEDANQTNPFSRTSVDFEQSDPSWLLVHSNANSKSIDCFQPQACPNLITMPLLQQNHVDKKVEDADQIVKEASEMVKLLESRIAALQVSALALNQSGEKKIAELELASPMKDAVNPRTQAKKHKLAETSMLTRPTLDPSSPAANSSCQQSPNLPNLSPAFKYLGQSPGLSSAPRPGQDAGRRSTAPSSLKSEKLLSSRPSQKLNEASSLNVKKNNVQRLESSEMSPSRSVHSPNPTPNFINGFIVSPSPSRNKMEKGSMLKPLNARTASVVSTSSRVNRPSGSSSIISQTGFSMLTRKNRNTRSKLIRSSRIPPRQYSSDDSDDSGSSISPSSSSSWTTTQQSGTESSTEECQDYSYSSNSQTESSTNTELEDSAASRSSGTVQNTRNRRRRSAARSVNRRQQVRAPESSNEKRISRLRRIKNKLGLIFHHHHHHHHHHHTVVRQPREKAEKKASDAAVKRVVAGKRSGQQGHFHGLLNGLMKHARLEMKNKKKSKPLIDDLTA